MKRRDFIFRGGAAIASVASPLASGAQSMPVIGFLSARSPVESTQLVAAFHDGLKGNGFVENQNLRIEYRWAEGQIDRLVQLASDLVNRQVTAIVAVGNTPSAYAAKAATTIIPIVFVVGDDPVKIGLVESLARPRGNLTGVTVLFGPLLLKRFEILHELMPGTLTIALLTNQNNPITDQVIKGAQEAARR